MAAEEIKIEGVELSRTGDLVTGVTVKDCKALPEASFQEIRKLEGVKALSLNAGLDEAKLAILAGMPAVESMVSNQMAVSDAGIATLATFKNLRNATFFHPGKAFTGQGLAALSALPNLESVSVGGSSVFSDAGMAAVAGLPRLKQLRIWHTAATAEGLKSLGLLKELKSLTLGQSLSMKPPPALNDDSLQVVAAMASLESLTVQEARLGLAALLKLKQLPNLRRLTLDGIDISENDLAELKKQLPAVEIKWKAPEGADKLRIEKLFNTPDGEPEKSKF